MTRAPRSFSARFALLACGGLTILAPEARAKQTAPFRAALTVRWGEGAGSDAFRDDVSRSLAANLAGRCFAGLVIVEHQEAPADTDVDLAVVLSQVVDETRFDDSIATTLKPGGEPGTELRRISHFEVTVDATLTARATRALVRGKHFVAGVSRRPLYVGEDAQATARAEVIDDIVVDLARALGCGGAKLERRIREALGGRGEAASGSR